MTEPEKKSEISTKLKNKEENKKKGKKKIKEEKEERDRRIREEAETRAQQQIYLEKVRKEQEKKAKEREKQKSNKNNDLYYFSFKYQIEDYAGNKIFQFTDFDGKKNKQYEIIEKKDKVIYINDEHPNHLKKGIVTKINIRPSINKVYFTVVFDDPPFVWEYNSRTGEKMKTNKKIKVIEEINFKNLKKIGSKIKTSHANSVRLQTISKNTLNIRNFLDAPYTDRRENLQQNNILLIFYQVILFILDLKVFQYQINNFKEETSPLFTGFGDFKYKESDEKKKKNKSDNFFKNSKIYMKQLVNNYDKFKIKPEKDKYVIDFIIFFNLSQKTCELLFKDNSNSIDLKKLNIPEDDKKLLLESSHRVNKKEEKIRIGELKKNAMEYFKILFTGILPSSLAKEESFGIYNDLDKIKFIKNIQNKKNDIEEKDVMTNQKRIEFVLKKRINEIFHIRRQIFPEVVKFKYAGKSNEEENTLITDPEKLVAPSESKIFKLNQIPVPVKVTQENDYELDENGKKQLKEKIFKVTKIGTNASPGEIEVFLKFSVDVETEKTPEEILEESKKSPTLRLIQSFMSSIKNKLNCTKSKLDFYENLHQIAKMIEPVKEFTIDDDDDNGPTYDMHTKFVKTTPTTTVVTNKIISRKPIETSQKKEVVETSEKKISKNVKKKIKNWAKKSKKKTKESSKKMNPPTKPISETKVKPVVSTGKKEQDVPIFNPELKKKQAQDTISGGGRKTVKLRLKKKNYTLKKYN